MAIRLVTFDMTGTLIKFKTPVMQQYAEGAAKFGIKTDETNLHSNFKKAWRELSAKHPNFGRNTVGWQNWWREIVIRSLNKVDRAEEVADHLIKNFETGNAWELNPGGRCLLENLKKRRTILGVVSNFDPRLHKIIENLGLTRYFDFVLTSYEVGVAKPDRGIFEMALKLGSAAPGETIHVGNDRELDYNGATAVGIHGVLLGNDENIPDFVTNLSDVEKCIKYFEL